MKVLSLRCSNGHGFDGWFASDDEYMDQNGRGLIECPLCADRIVSRLPSAPRLNLSGQREPAPAAAPAADTTPQPPALQALWLHAVRHMIANTDDVGERFPEEARMFNAYENHEAVYRNIETNPVPVLVSWKSLLSAAVTASLNLTV